jgi:acetylornithine deacetylase
MQLSLLHSNPVEILLELVRFKSLSTHEKDLVDWLESQVKMLDLVKVQRFNNNLIFTIGSGSPQLFLNSHSDVVPPTDTVGAVGFEPFLENDCVYGRGTTDAKGSGLAMLRALLELSHEGWKPTLGSVCFALTVCEETSGEFNGMAELRKLMDDGVIVLPSAAIIGEPTSLMPCIAQKGLLVLKLISTGDTGHAARIYGENAITKMANDLVILEKITFDTENSFIGKVKITPTRIVAGTSNNAMPEHAEVVIDVRTIPEVSNATIIQTIREQLKSEVHVHSDRFISTQTDPESMIAEVCREVTQADYFGSPTASDWVFLSDLPVVKLGPGNSELSHKPNENIPVSQLIRGIQVYKEIIRKYFREIEK